MVIWTMNGWDLRTDEKGQVYFPVTRHDGSLLKIPMALDMQPAGPVEKTDMQFKCLSAPYANYCGYQTGWIPKQIK